MIADKAKTKEQEVARARRTRITEIREKLKTAEGELKTMYEEVLGLYVQAEQQYQQRRRK